MRNPRIHGRFWKTGYEKLSGPGSVIYPGDPEPRRYEGPSEKGSPGRDIRSPQFPDGEDAGDDRVCGAYRLRDKGDERCQRCRDALRFQDVGGDRSPDGQYHARVHQTRRGWCRHGRGCDCISDGQRSEGHHSCYQGGDGHVPDEDIA